MESFPFSVSDLAALNAEITLTIAASVVLIWGALDQERTSGVKYALFSMVALVAALAGVLWGLPAQIADGNTVAFAGQLSVDGYGIFFSALFLITGILAIAASIKFLEDENEHQPEYYFFLLCSLIGMMIMARGIDLVSIFVGLELQALSVYVLVGFLKGDRRSNEGSLKYFILGGLSSGIFIYALSLIYAVAGATSLDAIAAGIVDGASDSPILMGGLILLIVSLAFKVAAVPFHLWAPDAYTGAPTPVTLFISVAAKAAAFAMAGRLLLVAFAPMIDSWAPLLAVLSVATMTFGNIAALSQDNVKRMFAYSSIAHAGYALIGLVAGTSFGMAATMYYLFAYTFMNVGAWAMIVLFRRNGMAGDRVEDFAGLGQRSGWAAFAMMIFLLSLGGIPPTIGFLGKWYVFGAAIDAGWTWLAVAGAFNAAISLYYYLRIALQMFMREPSDEVSLVHSMPLNVTLAVTAAMSVVGIVWASPFLEWVQRSTLPF